MNFIIALGQCALAGAFASWYFAFQKPDVSRHDCWEGSGEVASREGWGDVVSSRIGGVSIADQFIDS